MASTTPDLPRGFSIRPATLDDVEEMTDLLNAASIARTGAPDFTVFELLLRPGRDLSTRSVED